MPGGGLRLLLSCRKPTDLAANVSVVLFDDLMQCDWRTFAPATRQWTTIWNVPTQPLLIELSLTQATDRMRRVFWIAPNAVMAQ